MSQHLTTSRGDRVAYDVYGSGPAVLFVAGAGPYRAIDPVTTGTAERVAARGLTAVVHDRVGRGESRVAGRIGLDRELDAVAALLDAAGGSAVLVGHSSGCSIALAAAARGLPVDGLVLWEAPLDPPEEHGVVQAWVDEVDQRVQVGDLEGAMWHYMKDMPADFREGARRNRAFPDMVAQAGAYVADGESLAWASSAPLAELLADVRVPVLALVGQETVPGMAEAAQAVADAVPGARWERVPGAHHTWDVHAMADRIVAFVEETRARAVR
jgi:pimeloyl-ACP methyl ester carboxylesterase